MRERPTKTITKRRFKTYHGRIGDSFGHEIGTESLIGQCCVDAVKPAPLPTELTQLEPLRHTPFQ